MLHCLHFEAILNSIGYDYIALIRIMLITVFDVFIVGAIVVDVTMNAY